MKKAKALTTRSLVSDKLVATMKEIAKTASTSHAKKEEGQLNYTEP